MVYDNKMSTQMPFDLFGKIYTPPQAQSLLQDLMQRVEWQQEFVAFGRRFDVPRLQAWYADQGIHYRYTDNKLESHAWTQELLSIKRDVEHISGHSFNSVLLTCYRDGRDHVGWHADDEPELGDAPVIASLSLGAEREFQYRHKQHDTRGSLQLLEGELLVMQPRFQQLWEHRVPPQPEIDAPRLNLTFRKVIMQKGSA